MQKILLAIIAAAAVTLAAGCSSPLTAEQRAADKARRELVDSVANALASARLDSCTVLIPARSVQIGSGRVNSVTNEVTNFICARSGNAMFQLAPNHSIRSGANGLGGITLEGTLTLRKHSVDRRGNRQWEYSMGTSLGVCRILVDLPARSAQARVNVQGAFTSGSFTITGPVEPYDRSSVAVGRSL